MCGMHCGTVRSRPAGMSTHRIAVGGATGAAEHRGLCSAWLVRPVAAKHRSLGGNWLVGIQIDVSTVEAHLKSARARGDLSKHSLSRRLHTSTLY